MEIFTQSLLASLAMSVSKSSRPTNAGGRCVIAAAP